MVCPWSSKKTKDNKEEVTNFILISNLKFKNPNSGCLRLIIQFPLSHLTLCKALQLKLGLYVNNSYSKKQTIILERKYENQLGLFLEKDSNSTIQYLEFRLKVNQTLSNIAS